MKKVRESNYELMRILAMFAIVLGHNILISDAISIANNSTYLILRFIMCLCIIHVNLFILVSGYYQVKNKFSINKIFALIFEVFFYNLIINFTLKYTGLIAYAGMGDFLKQIFFLNLSNYWFLSYYLLLYMLSPFINQYLLKIDQKRFKQLTICLFVIDSILPLFTAGLFYQNNGYTLLHFIFMYILGAYIGTFKVQDTILKKINVDQKRAVYIITYLFCAIFNISLLYLSKYMVVSNSSIFSKLGNIIDNYFISYSYNTPIVIIQTLSIFLLFGTFNIKSKIINYIASCTMGIYLIHSSYYMGLNEYKWLHIADPNLSNGKGLLLRVLIGSLIIFFGSLIIESLRKLLFYLLNKTKLIKNPKERFINWVNKLIEIN